MRRFTRATFDFLRALAGDNDKRWFHAHHDDYLRHVRAPALGLVGSWAEALSPDYVGRATAAGGALSPPNRDTRFTTDKTPYRTHVALRLRHRFALPGAPGPTFLLWISPERSFLAAGVHAHNGESLRRIRGAILSDPERWAEVRGLGALDDDDMAIRLPAGVVPDHRFADDLRRRHYTVTRRWSQREVTAPDFVDRVVAASLEMRPFADFMADALYVNARPVAPAR